MFSISKPAFPNQLLNTHKDFLKDTKRMNKTQILQHWKTIKRSKRFNTDETKKIFKNINYHRCVCCSAVIPDFYNKTTTNRNHFFTIEHIKTKKRYPKMIFDWCNLLGVCEKCNNLRGEKKYIKFLYLDPSKVKGLSKYFDIKFNGEIIPRRSILLLRYFRAKYMIKMYDMNNIFFIPARRTYYHRILNPSIYNFYKSKSFDNTSIDYLTALLILRRRRNEYVQI